jgi:hypothetical protein
MQHVTIGGKSYTFDPNTGHYLDPVTGAVVQPKAAPKPQPNLTYKQMKFPDGTVHWVGLDPKTGKKVVPDAGLVGSQPTSKTGKTPTATTVSNQVDSWYTGKVGKNVPVVTGYDKQDNPKYTSLPPGTTYDDPDNPGKKLTVPGGVTGRLTYQQAYKRLRGMKYNDQQARTFLDSKWARGERGRPWLNVDERRQAGVAGAQRFSSGVTKGTPWLSHYDVTRLKQAGLKFQFKQDESNPKHYLIKTGYLGWITPKQAQSLRDAGMLPAGVTVDGRYYLNSY